ncbi:MAG TPA: hypothetical protein ENI82_01155 [Bacteroidetes bacterium]|nr:hypothetical protein [Bacteroidota bacterium]
MDKEDLLNSGLLKEYVLGLASPEEVEMIEDLCAKHPEINRKICQLQDSMENYCCMESVPAAKKCNGSLWASEEANAGLNNYHNTQSNFPWVTSVMILGLAGLSFFFYQNHKNAKAELAFFSREMGRLKNQCSDLQQKNSTVITQCQFLKNIGTDRIYLKGTAQAPTARAVIYWNENIQEAYLNIIDLPKKMKGHQYYAWANVNGKFVKMCRLENPQKNSNLIKLPFQKDCKAFVITLEEFEETTQPNLEKIYAQAQMSL